MVFSMSGKPIDILLVEDNPGDATLAREAFRDCKVRNQLYIVDDGVKALDFLAQRGDYEGMPLPDLILLDLNLPGKHGREVLQCIKNSKQLKSIPVVILTGSDADEDVIKSYALHANCFITKPMDLDQYLQVVKSIEDFWLTIVKLPPHGYTQ